MSRPRRWIDHPGCRTLALKSTTGEETLMPVIRHLIQASTGAVLLAYASVSADAQTFGFAAMQPGTINHTTSSAISKALKEKGGSTRWFRPPPANR